MLFALGTETFVNTIINQSINGCFRFLFSSRLLFSFNGGKALETRSGRPVFPRTPSSPAWSKLLIVRNSIYFSRTIYRHGNSFIFFPSMSFRLKRRFIKLSIF